MHLVLVNNNITATSSDEKTLSSFLLYLRAYSLDGVSIGTAFFFVFSLIPSLFFSFSSSSSSSFKHIYASRAFFFPLLSHRSQRSVGRSMLDDDDDDDDHFACNFYCLLFLLLVLFRIAPWRRAHFFLSFLARSNAYIHTHIEHKQQETILDMCKAVAFLLRLFPILFDVEMRTSFV